MAIYVKKSFDNVKILLFLPDSHNNQVTGTFPKYVKFPVWGY